LRNGDASVVAAVVLGLGLVGGVAASGGTVVWWRCGGAKMVQRRR
jgi:hypothetical protein